MSKPTTRKKTPFVIEPLNWVAPENKRNDTSESRQKETSDQEQDSKN